MFAEFDFSRSHSKRWMIYLLAVLMFAKFTLTVSESKGNSTYNSRICMDRIGLIVRSYSGDRHRMETMMIPHLQRFVNPIEFAVFVVLDEESPQDHEFGNYLQEKYSYIVYYEPKPIHEILSVRPFHAAGRSRYNTDGYVRQLYSTFFLDLFCDCEICGIIDADVQFSSFLTRDIVHDISGSIFVKAIENDPYIQDEVILKSPKSHNFMGSNVMPQFFYRSTFHHLRSHLISIHNVTTFNEFFIKLFVNYASPANILGAFATSHQPNRYKSILWTDRIPAVPSVAWNYVPQEHLHRIGCCRSFFVNCKDSDLTDTMHIIQPKIWQAGFYYKYLNWTDIDQVVTDHYATVHKVIHRINATYPHVAESMKLACST